MPARDERKIAVGVGSDGEALMMAEGFLASDQDYKDALELIRQAPQLERIKVSRRSELQGYPSTHVCLTIDSEEEPA